MAGGLVRWKLLLDGATTATLASRAPAIGSTAIAAHLHDECTLVVEIRRFAANAPTPLRVQACVGGYIPLHGDSVEFRGADLLKSIPFVELDGGDVHVWISKLPPP